MNMPEIFGFRTRLLRERKEGEEATVDFVELFFDLVFVFAVAQISHMLLGELSLIGLVEASIILLAIWWVWVDTTWVTNWLDPKLPVVRIMLFGLMLLGLVLASSIPAAFEQRGLIFAITYVLMQVGRSLFTMAALRHHHEGNFRNITRITIWQLTFTLFWLAGGLAEGEWRITLWTLALVIESVAPVAGFWVPQLGASTTRDWNVDGDHMAERCGLFIIIMLGETIIVAGAAFTDLEWNLPLFGSLLATFLTVITMWWLYFAHGAQTARVQIARSGNPGRMARLVYTYLHIVVVGGIIFVAVGNEVMLSHPLGESGDFWSVLMIVGGPLIFLFGNMLIAWATNSRFPIWRLAGMLALCALAALGGVLPPMPLGLAAAAVFLAVALVEFRTQPAEETSMAHHVTS